METIKDRKIAICLFGQCPFINKPHAKEFPYSEFVGDKYHMDGKNYSSLKSWEDYVLVNPNIDFFIHNWILEDKHSEKMEEIFKPKNKLFEPIRDFSENGKFPDMHNRQKSATYSMYKSVELMSAYQKENDCEYDLIMLIRPDVIWYKKLDINIFNVDKFTTSYWGKRYEDLNYSWNMPFANSGRYGTHCVYFAGNFNNIIKFSNMYLEFDELILESGPNVCGINDIGHGHIYTRYWMEKTELMKIIDWQLVIGKDCDLEVEYVSGLVCGW